MRQVLISGNQAVLARMPRPSIEPGCVLVRVHYSLISTGTELAALRPLTAGLSGANAIEKASALSSRAAFYLGKAIQNPQRAVSRVKELLAQEIRNRLPSRPVAAAAPIALGGIHWTSESAAAFSTHGTGFALTGDASPGLYQIRSQAMAVPSGHSLNLRLSGALTEAPLILGAIDEQSGSWAAQYLIDPGTIDDLFVFDVGARGSIRLVVANAGGGKPAQLTINTLEASWAPPDLSGLPASEMGAQGWGVGYSAAGEVIAVGDNVEGLAPGDYVACSGAGQANHADYILVRRNLACRLPDGCPLDVAATTTVGTIALQGVRRAAPQLGETVAVIGLGLLGLITVQLLRAAGCRVIGMDRDPDRVARALTLGATAASVDSTQFTRMVLDLTGGHGADQTIITAATSSNGPINTAMEATRRRGRVVIVGDVGLKAERAQFYRKEIDLLMSTSYGPGRYDAQYEEEGRDYPYAHVRWALNRNMSAYLQLASEGKINVKALIDRVAPVTEAGAVYRELATSESKLPVGVLFSYVGQPIPAPAEEPPEAVAIRLRGGRLARSGLINYALVGAGAFGTAMLVPQMDRRKDRYFLRAVVSRDAVRGGNFARSRQVELLTSDYDAVLANPDIELVVISTRHHDHASQVCKALAAGKHVFVEKPLALNWEQLDQVKAALDAQPDRLLMVGFNRRFAPAVEALSQAVAGRQEPLVIHYRLNGGYIPLESWIQGAQGGGRNIGEACHMYDLFRRLTGAPVCSIAAVSIDPGARPLLRSDNFTATMRYQDGSLATLTYTSLGPKEGLGKERIEVFSGGQAYVLDDFKSLTRAGDGVVLWQSNSVDKGHFEEMSRFADAIATQGEAPISREEILETTAVSLHIEDLLHERVYSA